MYYNYCTFDFVISSNDNIVASSPSHSQLFNIFNTPFPLDLSRSPELVYYSYALQQHGFPCIVLFRNIARSIHEPPHRYFSLPINILHVIIISQSTHSTVDENKKWNLIRTQYMVQSLLYCPHKGWNMHTHERVHQSKENKSYKFKLWSEFQSKEFFRQAWYYKSTCGKFDISTVLALDPSNAMHDNMNSDTPTHPPHPHYKRWSDKQKV